MNLQELRTILYNLPRTTDTHKVYLHLVDADNPEADKGLMDITEIAIDVEDDNIVIRHIDW